MTEGKETISSLTTQAADWYARLRAESVSEIDAARFRAWLARDVSHRRAFEDLDVFWGDLGAMAAVPEVLRERQAIGAGQRTDQRTDQRYGHRARWMPWTLAATVVLALGGALVLWVQGRNVQEYQTAVGEQRVIPLADGSVITLNTSTRLRLRYTDTRRAVELLAGQANFEVASDSRRPFVVGVAGGEVQALGTVFDLYRSGGDVTVTLIEGKVAVRPHAPGAADIVLTRGEQLSYSSGSDAIERRSADLPRVSAWRERKLNFSDTPLGDAIAEANRYSRLQIVLDAPELQDARISGSFEAGKNELFVEGLQTYFRLDSVRTADDRIVLTQPQ